MAVLAIEVTLTDTQAAILAKIARASGTTSEGLLVGAAAEHARNLVANFRQDVINRVPQILNKATEREQAELLAKFEEIDGR